MFFSRWRALVWPVFLFLIACTPQPTMEVPAEFKEGQNFFHKVCSNCHGPDALGKHTKAPGLIDVDYIPENFPDSDFRHTITHGTDKMPSQRKKVTDKEIESIIGYLRYSQKAADLQIEEDEEEGKEEDVDAG